MSVWIVWVQWEDLDLDDTEELKTPFKNGGIEGVFSTEEGARAYHISQWERYKHLISLGHKFCVNIGPFPVQ